MTPYASPDIEDGELGPAMKALPPRRRAFVDYVVTTGDPVWTNAVVNAGYTSNRDAAAVTAHRLSHDPRITAAIREESVRRVNLHLPLAIRTIIDIAGNPQHKDALKAALAVAGMSGLSPVSRTEHHVVHHDSLMDEVRAAANVLGVDAEALMRGHIRPLTIEHEPVRIADAIELTDPEGCW
jgi:phage terminase small subunit